MLWPNNFSLQFSCVQWLSFQLWAVYGPNCISGPMWVLLGFGLQHTKHFTEMQYHQTVRHFPCISPSEVFIGWRGFVVKPTVCHQLIAEAWVFVVIFPSPYAGDILDLCWHLSLLLPYWQTFGKYWMGSSLESIGCVCFICEGQMCSVSKFCVQVPNRKGEL